MSKIKNAVLDQYGAEPFKQQQFGTAGVEVVKTDLKNKRNFASVGGVTIFHIGRWCDDRAVGLLHWTGDEVSIREIGKSTSIVAAPRQTTHSHWVGRVQQLIQPMNVTVAAQRVCTETEIKVIKRITTTTT